MTTVFSELQRRNVLRVAALYLISAWLIAQVTDVVSGLAGWPPSVGRAVLVILACGFPVALALAWLFEWTGTGIRREDGAAGETALPRRQRIDYVIFAVLVVALGYFAANHDWAGAPPVAEASIAVLPFENRSALPEDRFFTDGVHDDLLTQLAKISSLAVISRTSVMRYRDSDRSIPDIGRELGVATILEGGVQRAGGQVRINLQLIEAATDRHLWAESYDRPLTAENVFEIQSEIATTIAGVLHAKLLPAEKERLDAIPTRSLEAYEEYLKGKELFASRDHDALIEAERRFLHAIEIDPEFALAHARLADVLSLLSEWDPDLRAERLARAEAAATRALVLDPGLGDAWASRGLVKRFRGMAPEDYRADMQRGVELAPGSADAHKWYANLLHELGDEEGSLLHIEKALALDPLSPIILVNLGTTLESFNRDDEAQAAYRRALEIDPTFMPARSSLELTGDEDLALLSAAYPLAQSDPWLLLEFVLRWLDVEDEERARQWLAHLEALAPDQAPTLIARMQVNLFRQDLDASAAFAQQLLPVEVAGMPIPTRLLAIRDIRAGKPGAALARYESKYPMMFSAEPPVAENAILASDIALVLLELGETDHARGMLRTALDLLLAEGPERGPHPEIPEARIHALLGEHDVALRKLEALGERGWTWRWWLFLRHDLAFESLRGDPRFVALAAEQSRKAREFRDRAREREARGEIVPPP